jgi:hypothetical protein
MQGHQQDKQPIVVSNCLVRRILNVLTGAKRAKAVEKTEVPFTRDSGTVILLVVSLGWLAYWVLIHHE